MNPSLIFVLLTHCLIIHADKEFASHGGHSPDDSFNDRHYRHGHHDPHADHEAFLGSKQTAKDFDSLSPEESKQRLAKLAEKMDKNSNGYVDETELYDWILIHMLELDAEEAHERFLELDENGDGYITWEEYKKGVFGEDELDDDDHKVMTEDAVYFKSADKDNDGNLNTEEYVAFQNPEQHQHMHDAVVQTTLKDKDTDRDGYIDLDEFLGEYANEQESEWYKTEKFRFTEEFDKNRDGRLDHSEMRLWLTPDPAEAARQETVHLMTEADHNRDGRLSYSEILDAHETFVGSEATNYGEHLVKHVEL